MKKTKYLILALLPLTIASCEKTNKNPISQDSSSQKESTSIISSPADVSSSSSQEETTLTPFGMFKVSTVYMGTLNKIGLKSTNNAYNISIDGDAVSTNAENETTTTQLDSTISITKGSTTLAVEGLKAKKADDIKASLKTSFDIEQIVKATEEGKQDQTYEEKDVKANVYYNSNAVYLDLSNKGMQNLLSKYIGISSGIPGHIKYSGLTIDEDSLPISNASSEDIISGLDYVYDEDNTIFDGIINFTKNQSEYNLNIHFTNTLLAFVPEIAKLYFKKNDSTLTPEQLNEKVKPIKEICDKTSIKKFDINISYDEQGYSYIDSDIDMTISDYSYTQSATDETGATTINIDNCTVIAKSRFTFQYGSDVVVAKQDSKDIYIDLNQN